MLVCRSVFKTGVASMRGRVGSIPTHSRQLLYFSVLRKDRSVIVTITTNSAAATR